jgi:hypothetical protein
LWDSHSSLQIVQALLDDYAADPLVQKTANRSKTRPDDDSDSSGTGTPAVSRKPKFLSRYVDRQAEIEQLLEHHWNTIPTAAPPICNSASRPTSASACIKDTTDPTELNAELEKQPHDDNMVTEASPPSIARNIADFGATFGRLPLADKTSNVTLDGDLLSNVQWSGGAIFSPPDQKSFRLTITPSDFSVGFPCIHRPSAAECGPLDAQFLQQWWWCFPVPRWKSVGQLDFGIGSSWWPCILLFR